MIVWVVIAIPVGRWCPWITETAAIVSGEIIASAIVKRVVDVRPAIPVPDFHAQVLIFIIVFFRSTILPIVLFRGSHVFILCSCGRIIHIVGCLTGFIRSGTAAKCGYGNCQE
jgi:hypothetical protein